MGTDINYKRIDLPDGNMLQIKFEEEGIVYDIFDKDGVIVEEKGYDLYGEDVPVKRMTSEELKEYGHTTTFVY